MEKTEILRHWYKNNKNKKISTRLIDIIDKVIDDNKVPVVGSIDGCHSTLSKRWIPEDRKATMSMYTAIHISFELLRNEELTVNLMSLFRYPGLEEKLMDALNPHFKVGNDGKVAYVV